MKKNNSLNMKALFLGSKSENKDLFAKIIANSFQEVAEWRKNFHPNDPNTINNEEKNSASFFKTLDRMEGVLEEMGSKMRESSIPWHSPRYLAHMNSETLMPGIIAYFYAMFFNSNNVAYESSPATSKMESEVGKDFCKLLGFDPEKGWGHICADGSIANYEGLWYARNFKSLPLAINELYPGSLGTSDEWELLNMPIEKILDFIDKNIENLDLIKEKTVRASNKNISKLGKILVPRTKHYSWLKAADILGLGTDNVHPIDVDDSFRMNIDVLEKEIRLLNDKKIPIMAVVSVVGTTEEGMFDYVDKVVELREKIKDELGIWFYYHIDAAYGGYVRSIFLNQKNEFIEYDDLENEFKRNDIFIESNIWNSRQTYNTFKNMGHADSITIDPHKMGYAPYAAGGIAIKDIRMRNAISYFATYVFDTKVNIPDLLGAYMIEGSKAGATAAAVWTNHQVLPTNITGYGKLIGHSIEGAISFYNHLENHKIYKIDNKEVEVITLIKPDFNMVDFVFNWKGNTSLTKMNDLNQKIYEESSFVEGETYKNNLILSHTSFSYEDYGQAPIELLKRTTIDLKEFKKDTSVTILRTCVLSPWLNEPNNQKFFFAEFDKAIILKITKILKEQ